MHCSIKLALLGKGTLIAMALFAGSIPARAVLIHSYELNGSLADSLGGPSLVAEGGTLNSDSYSFGPNQGLTLSGAFSTGTATNGNYSIEIAFRFSDLSGFRKILDFKNLGSDSGLYILNTAFNFFPEVTGASGAFSPNVNARVVFSRDGASGQVLGYVNAVQQLPRPTDPSFLDTSSLAVFDATTSSIIRFFEDDNVTGRSEASAGVVDYIRIYDVALTAAQVAALPDVAAPAAVVPEPAMFLLLGAGLAGISFMRKRSG